MAADWNNMERVTITDVLQPDFLLRSEDTYLAGVVLVVKKCDRPLKVFKAAVNKYKPQLNETAYDRMVILGEMNSRTCFVIISDSSSLSGVLLRHENVTLGSYVAVVEPIFTENCLGNDQANPIIATTKSFVPFPNAFNLELLEIEMNPLGTAIIHFALQNLEMQYVQAQFVTPTCSGVLCDRRVTKVASQCGCIQKSPVAGWTIKVRVLAADNDLFGGVFFQSFNLAKVFCTTALLRQPVTSLNERNLRQAVNRIQTFVNNAGGWHVEGFVKSGLSDENITQSVQQVRICRVVPSCVVPEDIKYDVRPFVQHENAPPPLRQHGDDNWCASSLTFDWDCFTKSTFSNYTSPRIKYEFGFVDFKHFSSSSWCQPLSGWLIIW